MTTTASWTVMVLLYRVNKPSTGMATTTIELYDHIKRVQLTDEYFSGPADLLTQTQLG